MVIKPTSRYRLLMYISLAAGICLLSWLAELALWQYVVLLVVSVLVVSYLLLSKPITLHISQPPLSKRVNSDWQLLMRTGRADELWQASLEAAYHYHRVIHLRFRVNEPFERPLSLTIFRDQVNVEHWRQLCILASSVDAEIV